MPIAAGKRKKTAKMERSFIQYLLTVAVLVFVAARCESVQNVNLREEALRKFANKTLKVRPSVEASLFFRILNSIRDANVSMGLNEKPIPFDQIADVTKLKDWRKSISTRNVPVNLLDIDSTVNTATQQVGDLVARFPVNREEEGAILAHFGAPEYLLLVSKRVLVELHADDSPINNRIMAHFKGKIGDPIQAAFQAGRYVAIVNTRQGFLLVYSAAYLQQVADLLALESSFGKDANAIRFWRLIWTEFFRLSESPLGRIMLNNIDYLVSEETSLSSLLRQLARSERDKQTKEVAGRVVSSLPQPYIC